MFGFGENHKFKCFFSKKSCKNHLYVHTYYNIRNILLLLKNTYNNNLLSLIDITGTDISKLNNYNLFSTKNNKFFFTNLFYQKLIQYNLIDYKTSYRFILNFFKKDSNYLNTLEFIFKNSNWLERELIEFLNIKFNFKIDTRNLLLDYNTKLNPLLKNFPVEGNQELYYNFQNNTLDYLNTEFVEL